MTFSTQLFRKKFFLLIILINIGIYILQVIQGINWLSPELTDLIAWGANIAPLTLTGESWRLLSSLFLHSGLIHLMANMYMLLICGRLVENVFGTINFAIIYFVSGLFASLTSALWHAHHKAQVTQLIFGQFVTTEQLQAVVSIGASGAIMGLASAILVSTYSKQREQVHIESPQFRSAITQTIIGNLALGFVIPDVDNACHIGGFLAGGIIAALLMVIPQQWGFIKRNLAAVSMVGIACILVYYVTQRKPSDELQELASELRLETTKLAEEKRLALERQQVNAQIELDHKNAPMPVDEKTAAGLQIPLDAYINDIKSSIDGKRLYLPHPQDNILSILDTQIKSIANKIPGPVFKEVHQTAFCPDNICLGRGANYVGLSPDEHFAYVSSMVEDAVAVVDLQKNKIIASIPTGRYPGDLRISSDGKYGYVINIVDNSVAKLDLTTNQMIGSAVVLGGGTAENLPFGRTVGIWLSADNQQLFVLDGVANAMEVIAANTMNKITTVPLSEGNWFHGGSTAINNAIIWLKGKTALEAFNTETLKIDEILPFCFDVAGFNIDSNHDNSLIALSNYQYILLVKPYTRKLVGIFPSPGMTGKLLFSKDGQQLYALNNQRPLVVIDPKKSINMASYIESSGEPLCGL